MHSFKLWFYKIVFLVCIILKNVTASSSVTQSEKHTDWSRSEILDSNGLYLLEWKIIENNIIFQATVNIRGYIGLGFSYKNENMSGSDLILAWVDDNTGKPNILVCCQFEYSNFPPKILYQILFLKGLPRIFKRKYCCTR